MCSSFSASRSGMRDGASQHARWAKRIDTIVESLLWLSCDSLRSSAGRRAFAVASSTRSRTPGVCTQMRRWKARLETQSIADGGRCGLVSNVLPVACWAGRGKAGTVARASSVGADLSDLAEYGTAAGAASLGADRSDLAEFGRDGRTGRVGSRCAWEGYWAEDGLTGRGGERVADAHLAEDGRDSRVGCQASAATGPVAD